MMYLDYAGDDTVVALTCDPYWFATRILLYGEGTEEGIVYTNSAVQINQDDNTLSYSASTGKEPNTISTQKRFGERSIRFYGDGAAGGTGGALTAYNLAYGIEDLDFTIEMWVRFHSAPTTSAYLFDYRPAANGVYATLYVNSSKQLRYYVNSSDRITSSTSLNDNQWYHIAVARKNGVTKLFIDGTQTGSSYTDTNVYLGNTIKIGASGISSPYVTYAFNGYIDEFRMTQGICRYADAFTPSSISDYAVQCAYTEAYDFIETLSPAAWWKLDEDYGVDPVADSWGANHTYTNSGSDASTVMMNYGGNAGGAIPLVKGGVHAVTVNSATTWPGYATTTGIPTRYTPTATTSYYGNTITIAMVIRTMNGFDAGDAAFWHQGNINESGKQGMWVWWDQSENKIMASYVSGGSNRSDVVATLSTDDLQDSRVYHIAIVHNHTDGSNGSVEFYLNGTSKGSVNLTYAPADTTAKGMFCGVLSSDTTTDSQAKVTLDNPMIFDGELSAQDISDLSTACLATWA